MQGRNNSRKVPRCEFADKRIYQVPSIICKSAATLKNKLLNEKRSQNDVYKNKEKLF